MSYGMIVAFLSFMEKRSFERFDANLPVKYYCDDRLYSGTVRNISEKGMFINTANFLPCIDRLEIIIPLEEEISKFSARIKRVEKIDDLNYSMGIEIVDPPENYTQFVSTFRFPVNT
jgi:hypothetical protein